MQCVIDGGGDLVWMQNGGGGVGGQGKCLRSLVLLVKPQKILRNKCFKSSDGVAGS